MEPVAIIGMDCIFPGAPDLASYWHNIQQGVDAISEVPEHRWSKTFFDPDSAEVDRFYCRRGGFIDEYAEFDPIQFGIMPNAVAGVEPDQLLGLRVGAGALRDAGYLDRDFPREKTAVILGRGNYAGAATLRLQHHVRTVQQTLQTVQDLWPHIGVAELQRVREHLRTWPIPALVMFSDGDPVFRPEVGQQFAHLLPGALGVMDTITGASHMLQEDKGEEIADRILDWVGAAPAG